MKTLFTFLFACCLTVTMHSQTILIVDNNSLVDTSPAHMFNNMTAAISAAANGDTIYVQPSITSYGNINVNKSLTIIGIGHEPELNAGRDARFVSVAINANDVTIHGLVFTSTLSIGGTRTNLRFENNYFIGPFSATTASINDVIVSGNIFEGPLGINATTSSSVNVTITHNFFNTPGLNGIQNLNSTTIFNNNIVVHDRVTTQPFFSNPNDLVAQNNIFVFTSSFNGTNWSSSGTPVTYNNNITYSYPGATLGALPGPGSGNFNNTNPNFVTIPGNNPLFNVDNDYDIGITANGTDGNDVGLFNMTYDFDMRGYPTLLPYITELAVTNNIIQAGQNLQVNLKANANKTN